DYVARVWDNTDWDKKVQDEAVWGDEEFEECPHEDLMAEADFQLNTQASTSPSPNMPPKSFETPADLHRRPRTMAETLRE
ncbi:hypothetical protein PROFUN_10311, partial [Planoprotostelium fungivorum]